MTCPYHNDGRCRLGELLAERELHVSLVCPTTPENCAKCLSRGAPCEDGPPIQCIGTVTRVCPKEKLPAWSAFASWMINGKSRGLGDTVAKVAKVTGVATVVKAGAKALGVDCGCLKRQAEWNAARPYASAPK